MPQCLSLRAVMMNLNEILKSHFDHETKGINEHIKLSINMFYSKQWKTKQCRKQPQLNANRNHSTNILYWTYHKYNFLILPYVFLICLEIWCRKCSDFILLNYISTATCMCLCRWAVNTIAACQGSKGSHILWQMKSHGTSVA